MSFDILKSFRQLSTAFGPSGREQDIIETLTELTADTVHDIGAWEHHTDAMNNLIYHRPGTGKTVLLAAHMDSIGVVVTHIDEDGFARFAQVGGLMIGDLIDRQVRFQNGTRGVISFEEKTPYSKLGFDNLFLDIGAASKEQAEQSMGRLAVIPTALGFCIGMIFLLLLDLLTPHMHMDESVEGPKSSLRKTTMLVLAVVIHNIPEGMAVGVLYAGWMQGNSLVTISAALSLSIGIAIQNFPEGAIISMPLHANGMSKGKACIQGILSGAVEPIAGIITILLASIIVPFMPVLLSFAAGAMIYVVVEELIPEMSEGKHSNWTTISFMVGFAGMMVLDIAFG